VTKRSLNFNHCDPSSITSVCMSGCYLVVQSDTWVSPRYSSFLLHKEHTNTVKFP